MGDPGLGPGRRCHRRCNLRALASRRLRRRCREQRRAGTPFRLIRPAHICRSALGLAVQNTRTDRRRTVGVNHERRSAPRCGPHPAFCDKLEVAPGRYLAWLLARLPFSEPHRDDSSTTIPKMGPGHYEHSGFRLSHASSGHKAASPILGRAQRRGLRRHPRALQDRAGNPRVREGVIE